MYERYEQGLKVLRAVLGDASRLKIQIAEQAETVFERKRRALLPAGAPLVIQRSRRKQPKHRH